MIVWKNIWIATELMPKTKNSPPVQVQREWRVHSVHWVRMCERRLPQMQRKELEQSEMLRRKSGRLCRRHQGEAGRRLHLRGRTGTQGCNAHVTRMSGFWDAKISAIKILRNGKSHEGHSQWTNRCLDHPDKYPTCPGGSEIDLEVGTPGHLWDACKIE